jgi:hypothetical protein
MDEPWLDISRPNPAKNMVKLDPLLEARAARNDAQYLDRVHGKHGVGWGGKNPQDDFVEFYEYIVRKNRVIDALRNEPVPLKRAVIWGWWAGGWSVAGKAAHWLITEERIHPDGIKLLDISKAVYKNPLIDLKIYAPIEVPRR